MTWAFCCSGDRAKRAAKKTLSRLPVGRYGTWDVTRESSGRETVDLEAVRKIFKANGLGPVPMKTSAPSLKVRKVELVQLAQVAICAACDRTWDVSELSEDGNGDPTCSDCLQLHASLDDRAEYRAYAHH